MITLFMVNTALTCIGTHITLVGDQVQQALLDSQQVWGGRHHHVNQDFWNYGDEGVLPGEGIKEGSNCMKYLR